VNLFGPGGVGKSALATWLAYQYYREGNTFEAILHPTFRTLAHKSK
jgi:replication-associated recombination protein RarA